MNQDAAGESNKLRMLWQEHETANRQPQTYNKTSEWSHKV